MEVTALTVQEGQRAVVQAAVKNCGETRGYGHPCIHHVTCQLSGVARGYDVWSSEWEARVSALRGPSQRKNSSSPHVCGGQHRQYVATRVRWTLGRDHHPPHHIWIEALIMISIHFCAEAQLFQAFSVTPTDLSEPTVVAEQKEDPT